MIEVSKIKEYLELPVNYYTKVDREAGYSMLAFAKKLKGGQHLRNGCSDCIARAYYLLKKFENMADDAILGGNEYKLNNHYEKCGFRNFGETKYYRNSTTTIEERKELFNKLDENKRGVVFDLSTCNEVDKPKRKRRTKAEIEADNTEE